MSFVLVDTSIWIDYFRGNPVAKALNKLIETNQIATNELILAELLPFITFRKEKNLGHLLQAVKRFDLRIDWQEVIRMQTKNLESGNNNVGIPDIIIAQNAIQNDLTLFENDKHFRNMKSLFGLDLFRKDESEI